MKSHLSRNYWDEKLGHVSSSLRRATEPWSELVRHAERALSAAGCMKINLQVLSSNEATAAFHRSLGYGVEPRISTGRVLRENVPSQDRV
jgi:hypothetical protein